jgi:hypothetical protein
MIEPPALAIELHDAIRLGDGAAAERADRLILERALKEIVATFEHVA